MKPTYILLFSLSALLFLGNSCKKGDLGAPKRLPANVPDVPNIFNMFNVKLDLHGTQPYSVGEDGLITIGTNDSALVEYTIESPDQDMYQVALYKTGGGLPQVRIPITEGMDRRSYTGSFVFYGQDLGAGSTTSYRIWAYDVNGVYLGDGYKRITINVLSDIKYFTNRKVFSPDSATGELPCYVSLSDGALYSYKTGSANAKDIDFGIFQRWDTTWSDDNYSVKRNYYLYSLSADPLPFTHYDIGSWTRRGTLFSDANKGNANDFKKKFTTSAKIEKEATKKPIELTMVPTPLASNQFIYFKTPEGKYGVLFIQAQNSDYKLDTYFQMVWRIQDEAITP
ncbi:hypothetical protein GCM10027051_24110 [Niabella terrae]